MCSRFINVVKMIENDSLVHISLVCQFRPYIVHAEHNQHFSSFLAKVSVC